MLDFLKKMFPQKGENMDLNEFDDMYRDDQDDGDYEVPRIYPSEYDEEHRVDGLVPTIWRNLKSKFSRDKVKEIPEAEPDSFDKEIPEAESDFFDDDYSEKKATPGILTRINNLEGAPKYAFLGVCTCVVVLLIGLFTHISIQLFKGDNNKTRAVKPAVTETRADTLPDKGNMPFANMIAGDGSKLENPFINVDGATNANDQVAANTSDLPAIPAETRNLPAIPSVPLPDVPVIAAPMSIPDVPAAVAAPVVQGVITSNTDEKENVAIMGDGSVVSVGETYNDGRIAYIGGDGITFEDGRKIQIQQW